ncbi:MAG: cytochrome c biogenesis protein CcsA [Chloroflexota bacterium]
MEAKPSLLKILDVVALGSLITATGLVFFYAPLEAVMGAVQKVFYFHVATAWAGMLGFLVAAIAGVTYLVTTRRRWDIVGLSAVEISVVFLFIAIVTGSIWARPTWNSWWTWDPRLTTATIMELVYAAYLMLRQGIEDPERRARFGAVYVIVGFISVPLTFLSIRIFRTIHPVVIGGGDPNSQGTFDMTPKMLQTFLFSLLTFSVVFGDLMWHRMRLGWLADKVEQLKIRYHV